MTASMEPSSVEDGNVLSQEFKTMTTKTASMEPSSVEDGNGRFSPTQGTPGTSGFNGAVLS